MAISKERAWQEVKDLSYERVTGTEDEKRAAEYLKAECAKLGVEAHFETYEIEKSTIEKVELTVGGKSYNVIGIGKTASTPDEGIDAPVVYLRDGRGRQDLPYQRPDHGQCPEEADRAGRSGLYRRSRRAVGQRPQAHQRAPSQGSVRRPCGYPRRQYADGGRGGFGEEPPE